MDNNWLWELLGGDPQWLDWLDQKSRGVLSWITLGGVTIGCGVVALHEYGSLWQLAPVTLAVALLAGVVALIRWRLGVDDASAEGAEDESEAWASADEDMDDDPDADQ